MCRDTDLIVSSMSTAHQEGGLLDRHGQHEGESPDACQEFLVQVAADTCCLAAVKLVAVQPACLRAHQETPVQLQELQQERMLAIAPAQQQQHDVLLQLEAVLLHGDEDSCKSSLVSIPDPEVLESTTGACPSSHMHPLLQHSMLEVVVLSRCMQLMQQQQFSLLDLILQQQEQHQAPHRHLVRPAAIARTSSTCAITANSASEAAPSEPVSHSSSFIEGQGPSTCAVCQAAGSDSWSVHLNLHVSFPNLPTTRLLDALHLVLLVRTARAAAASDVRTVAEQASITSVSPPCESSHSASDCTLDTLQPGPALVAEVPLLVLPAVAQQEVQQLLLPAMRQEVQAEQQQQEEQEEPQELTPAQISASYMDMESAVWRHFSQLANDMYTVLQLAGEAAASTDVGSAAATTSPAVAVVPVAVGQEAAVQTPAVALADVAHAMLFPLLLPFLAAHGLHNLLLLLVGCLPAHLQQQWQQWQQQQLQERLGVLAEAAPAPFCLPAEGSLAHTTAPAAAPSGQDGGVSFQTVPEKPRNTMQLLLTAESDTQEQQQGINSLGRSAKQQPQQHGSVSDSSGMHKRTAHATKASAPAAAAEQEQSIAADVVSVSSTAWYTPLVQFAPAVESRYLDWKHRSLLNLDYLGALFAVMYLAVLVRKLMCEPATLFYVMYILIKTLPHVPLVLGFRQLYLRYREHWLFMVAPACLLLTWCFSMHSIVQGRPAMLLPNRAYKAFWSGRAELATSAMRPFTQHMRLRKYIIYCVLDGIISAWVFGQIFGVLAAAQRWSVAVGMSVGIAWVFEVCMRQRFVECEKQRRPQEQHRQAAQERKLAKGIE